MDNSIKNPTGLKVVGTINLSPAEKREIAFTSLKRLERLAHQGKATKEQVEKARLLWKASVRRAEHAVKLAKGGAEALSSKAKVGTLSGKAAKIPAKVRRQLEAQGK